MLDALRAVAAAVVAGLVVGSPQLVAMVQQARAGGNGASAASLGYATWVASLPSLFAPSPRLTDDGLSALGHIYTSQTRFETLNTFGVVLSLLAVAGLVARWRRRSAWLLLLLWLGGAALALGPVLYTGHHLYVPFAQIWQGVRVSALMPYTWFIRVPGLSVFREADRLALLGLVGAALLAGAAVDWLAQRRAWPVIARGDGSRRARGGLGRVPGGQGHHAHHVRGAGPADRRRPQRLVVVDVPFGLDNEPSYGLEPAEQGILMATADGHPRAICYTSWVPTATIAGIAHQRSTSSSTRPSRAVRWTRTGRAARADLRTLHAGWVVVWLPRLSPDLSRYLSATGFRLDYQADGAIVYRPARRRITGDRPPTDAARSPVC